jgi:cobalt-zinc-cadmium efflux system protein
VVTLLVVRSAWRLVRESVDVLLEATPSHISLGRVREGLQAIGGIESVHDLHVWTVTSGMVAMSAHAVVREPGENQKVLEAAVAAMQRLGISHVTLQVERDRICDPLRRRSDGEKRTFMATRFTADPSSLDVAGC